MKTIPFKTLSQVSSMRKFAISAWSKPRDPSVHVQLDFDITALYRSLKKNTNISLYHVFIKACSVVLHEFPMLNTTLNMGRVRCRLNNRIFVPTIFRHQGLLDLSGISIDNAYDHTVEELAIIWKAKIKALRVQGNQPVHRVVRLFKALPLLLCKPLLSLIDFLQYTCNFSLASLGVPVDPFGSMTVTFLDKFDIKYADIPLFPFSRSPITLAVGKMYQSEGRCLLPVTCTFDHRFFDGLDAYKAYKRMAALLKDPKEIS